jgi:tRNA (guanine-N7-)-methyltransferase
MPMSKRGRVRAHSNPLAESAFEHPISPDRVEWSKSYPKFFDPVTNPAAAKAAPEVTVADVGCGFGGLLVALSTLFPARLILGLEIRDAVVDLVEARIQKLRAEYIATHQITEAKEHTTNNNTHNTTATATATAPTNTSTATTTNTTAAGTTALGVGSYQNVSVVRTNIMKFAPNYFRKGQLEKMFFLFPDPHFKKSKFRRRVINSNFLAMYAYALRVGGILYTITDVKALHEWMVQHLTAHPLFQRIPDSELSADPCVEVMANATEEGQKVSRLNGNKYPAVFRRVAFKEK